MFPFISICTFNIVFLQARYKLLLDWVRNDDDETLGKLANVLWDDGQRQIVKELATLYNGNK